MTTGISHNHYLKS